jgi:YidC/Oxa1 family membrane protein insertase
MDTQRFVALAIFFVTGFMLWEKWQMQEHPPRPQATAQSTVPTPAAGNVPSPSAAEAKSGTATSPSGQVAPGDGILGYGDRLEVTTDVVHATIDTMGGDLRDLVLTRHLASEDNTRPLTLMRDKGVPLYVVQSGLIGAGLPNHTTRFVAAGARFDLAPGQDKLEVKLTATTAGAEVVKTYTFRRGSYVIDVSMDVHNTGPTELKPFAYFQFLRDGSPAPGDPRFINTYTGPAFYTESDKFKKVSFSDIDKGKAEFPQQVDNGWMAMLQHYFVAAWLPKQGVKREFFAKKNGDKFYTAGVILPAGGIAPQGHAVVGVPLYAGPQEGERLRSLAPGLDLTIDYGWLTLIAQPMFRFLSFIQGWVGNWGVAIIILTVLIKLLFFPLSAASYKSMAKMRVVAPKLQRLKEQYGDDRQKLHEAMMELYKTEKINPLGGCLPVVVQIPVFISLYWVLLASVELRHAPFFGWIHDLSAQDPYYILPVIMGISMLVQTKLNPTPPDPVQAKVMMIMPFAFSIFFFFFPAGLVLYWVVNNVLSIAQQWQITRMIEGAAAGRNRVKR